MQLGFEEQESKHSKFIINKVIKMAKARVAMVEFDSTYQTNEDFTKLFADNNIEKLEEGSTVKGIIVSKDDEAVLIDIGFKSEGRVALKDFPDSERDSLSVGDEVSVFVERMENAAQEIILSRHRAVQEENWGKLEKAFKKTTNVDGVITTKVKGGFVVDFGGCLAFLPGSQVDVRPIKDVTPLMNIVQPFQILKMDRVRGNIIVSRRAIMEESLTSERQEVLSKIKEGDEIDGIIKNITDYGAFVDLGAVDGLLHVTDISWSRINHPSEVLKVGEKIRLKVIKFDEKSKRISLGLKQLKNNPWDNSDGKFGEGTKHKGKITNITDYGVFVELSSGIEGLVHVSEMTWGKKNVNPSQLYKKGEEVEVMILSIEPEKQRLSLGIKQCQDNPWTKFAQDHKKGDTVEGTIKSITDFGIFVGFDKHPEADGLVHISDISWSEKGEEAIKKFNKGDKVNILILELEPNKEKISLSIKHLTEDPNASAFDAFEKGKVQTFTVTEVKDEGITVQVSEGVTSFIKRNELSKDKVECRPERFAVGDRIDAKIVGLEKKTKEVKLSIKAYEMDEEKKAIEKYGSADSGASLGGILGQALSNAKSKPEKAAKAEKTEKKADKKETKKKK